jgi:hypothetical protein
MTNVEGMRAMTKLEGTLRPATPHDDFDDAFWSSDISSIVREDPSESRVYDLEERTARFGEMIIDFAKAIPQNPVTHRIIAQLVGEETSVGANYVEADDAVSKKEFLKSIGTCRKEGSAPVSGVGGGVPLRRTSGQRSAFWRDAKTDARDGRAPLRH